MNPLNALCWFAAILAITACIVFSSRGGSMPDFQAYTKSHNQLLQEAGR